MPSIGCFAVRDARFTIDPPPPSRMTGIAARLSLRALMKIKSKDSRHWSSDTSSTPPVGGPTVLLTRMSSPPRVDVAQAKSRSHSSYRPRSAASACTSPPAFAISRAAASMLGSELDVTQTRQSSASSDSATARPSPRLAAVTRARLPRRPSSMTRC